MAIYFCNIFILPCLYFITLYEYLNICDTLPSSTKGEKQAKRSCQLCVSDASYCIYLRCEYVINDVDHCFASWKNLNATTLPSVLRPRLSVFEVEKCSTKLHNELFAHKLEYSPNWTFLIIFFMTLLKPAYFQFLINVMELK